MADLWTPEGLRREILLSYEEVALSVLPLEKLLSVRGINPSLPYTQEDAPPCGHIYSQLVELGPA